MEHGTMEPKTKQNKISRLLSLPGTATQWNIAPGGIRQLLPSLLVNGSAAGLSECLSLYSL